MAEGQDEADPKEASDHKGVEEGESESMAGWSPLQRSAVGSPSQRAHAERQKKKGMSVFERTEYEINKTKAHLTAGANSLHGASKSYNSMRPQEVAALQHHGVREIYSGQDHLIAVDHIGRLIAWGRGESGQLGLGDFKHSGAPRVISSLDGRDAEGKVTVKLKQVVCGSAYSAALMDSGKLYTWGRNAHGQLGHGDRDSSAIPRPLESMHRRHVHQIACGAAHMLALTTARDVFTWGSNQYGQLGHGEPGTNSPLPKQVRVMSGLDVKQLAAGENHSCVLTSFGDIYTWGRGDYGQLGHGNQLSKDTPTLLQALDQRTQASWLSVGSDFMVAVTYSGTVYSWGRNHFGQLGHGIKNDHLSRAQRLPDDICSPQIIDYFSPQSGDKILLCSIVCGSHHVLAISEKRDILYAWGRGEHGQLGLDPRDCTYKATPQVVVKVQGRYLLDAACGLNHSVIVATQSATSRIFQVLTWGRGSYGQLGHGSGRIKVADQQLYDLRRMIRSPIFSSNRPPSQAGSGGRSRDTLRASSPALAAQPGARPATSLGIIGEHRDSEDAEMRPSGAGRVERRAVKMRPSTSMSNPESNAIPTTGKKARLTRGRVTVPLHGYVEATDSLRRKGNASGRGRQSGGQERGAGASGGLLAASCEARPSNMYRAPSAEPTGHLASLRSILSSEASFSSSASAARFPEASVERSDTSSYFPARIGSLETSQHTRSLVTRLMIASRAPYKTHSEDPAPLSMQDLLALVDDELEQS